MWQGLAGVLTGGLSRFRVVGLLPATFLVSAVLAVFALGDPPRWGNLKDAADDLSGTHLLLLALGVACLALLTHSLQLPLVRLLEGYWAWWPHCPARLATLLVFRHRRRLEKLVERSSGGVPDESRLLAARSRRGIWRETRALVPAWRQQLATARLMQEFPDRENLLPTRLGNALRAAELAPYRRYRLDAVTVWPALYGVLGPRVREAVDDQRDQLDFAVRISVALGLLVPLTAVRFALAGREGLPWLAVPAVLWAGSFVAYRTAVSAAVAYGVLIRTAFDLHRFDLFQAFHLRLPDDSDSELCANQELTAFLSAEQKPVRLNYVHPDPGPPRPPS
ncbi:hypothetical protein DI272_30240 [Streptomyces sp. Act143]|nr:hypothetical protein DI272_30240 [Streptomyces sp. Act143]